MSECAIKELVEFIRAHQPISFELVLIDDSLRIVVCSVWSSFGDVSPEFFRLSDIELLLVAFDSQLKIKSWEVTFSELVELLIFSLNFNLLQILVIIPLHNFNMGYCNDSFCGEHIILGLYVACVSIEPLSFRNPVCDFPDSICIISYLYWTL
nr:hypothetical protein [Tanacetum cinerariifolium]